MRSPLWFVVAGLIALAGFVGAALYLMPRLETVDARLMRVVVPGGSVLTLDKPGAYTIYHEQKSFVDGQYHASDSVGGLRVGLIAEATGTASLANGRLRHTGDRVQRSWLGWSHRRRDDMATIESRLDPDAID